MAAVRSGQCLLAGLVRCGACGRKLHVQYQGRLGTKPRYLCKGEYEQGGNYCLSFAGRPMDRRFSEELLKVISPLGVQASLAAIESLSEVRDDRRKALERQLEQLDYEAERACEQYNEVDARNRLVAAELEHRWNAKLAEVERAKAALAEQARQVRKLTPGDEQNILRLGERFGEAWNDPVCPVELKKKIVCTVVEEVIAHLASRLRSSASSSTGREEPTRSSRCPSRGGARRRRRWRLWRSFGKWRRDMETRISRRC